jgi:hypothetical protein
MAEYSSAVNGLLTICSDPSTLLSSFFSPAVIRRQGVYTPDTTVYFPTHTVFNTVTPLPTTFLFRQILDSTSSFLLFPLHES